MNVKTKTCSHHILSLEFSCTELEIQWTICRYIALWVSWRKNKCFSKRFTCNSTIVNSFYQQPGQFSQVGTWSRSGKEIHVALNITDGLPTETLRLKNSSPLIVKTRLVSCYGVLKATTLMLGQVMWGSHFVLKYVQLDCFVLWYSRQKLISHEPNSVCWLPNCRKILIVVGPYLAI